MPDVAKEILGTLPARDPSRWSHRLPLVVLALCGFGIATYLTLYQVGSVATVWEPFFGDGSRTILNSNLARALPVPDASLGAAAYLAEVITGLIGGERRWITIPWVVLLNGLIVLALGIGSIVLVILQGAWFHAWCTLCLGSAVISIVILLPGLIEPRATARRLWPELKRGESPWRLLRGGNPALGD